jgi:hypothetical protein
MTYDQIRKVLLGNNLDVLARDLDSAVEDEADALSKQSHKAAVHERQAARDYYAEEITTCLRMRPADRVITPQDILQHRRTPTAKAIACLMIEAGIKMLTP